MLRNRLFLIGLGMGIIIGALLFQLMLSGEQSRARLAQRDAGPDEKQYTQVEVDALIKAERDSVRDDQKTTTEPETSPEVKPTPSPEVDANKENEAAEAVPEEVKPAAQHVVRIKAGLGLSKTAELLASHQIINNEAAFVSSMKKSKKLVRAGYFLFYEGSTVEQAITIVTSQPLTEQEAASWTDGNQE
ncbi:hypothetical protein [Paenibacillus sinopodophylli]|uniref:hypothetical protein n=1 Tax=Paenibacillus sinopodophylli TaxID=1837342 RepID=UPI00110CF4F0|nr:hypothetical protein [Paenibacillus sinopodophylli]